MSSAAEALCFVKDPEHTQGLFTFDVNSVLHSRPAECKSRLPDRSLAPMQIIAKATALNDREKAGTEQLICVRLCFLIRAA